MSRAAILAVSLSACGYSWTPPAVSSPTGVHFAGVTAPTLGNPDELAVVTHPHGKGAPDFTFVDGRGHELTAHELAERYAQAVGHDDVGAILSVNNVLAKTSVVLVLGLVALGGLTALPQRSGCTPGAADVACKSIVLVGLAGFDLFLAWAFGLFKDPFESAKMDLDDADYVLRRFNAAVGGGPIEDVTTGARFRWGIAFGGGALATAGLVGGAGRVAVELGVQLNDLVGAYYETALGARFDSSGDGGFFYNALALDVTVGPLDLGAGPSLDALFSASKAAAASPVPSGAFFGLASHAALAIGPPRPGRKPHLVLGVDVHPTFTGATTVTTLLATVGVARF
jgi:hypothetical protein